MIKIFFYGTHNFASDVLKKILELNDFQILAVATAPDKPVGREKKINISPVKLLAQKMNIPVYQPESLNDFLPDELKKADLGLVVEYGKIMPKNILEIPKYKTINIHASILPKYRGASPIQSAIINGESTTGITLMLMDEKMDHGPIIAQKKLSIDPDEIKDSLSSRLSLIASELFIDTIAHYISGKIIPTKQDHSSATFCKILTRENGKIDFNKTSRQIYNQYRALTPWPGIWCLFEEKRLKLNKISIANENIEPKKIIFKDSNIFIGCNTGSINVLTLQLEGKKEMPAVDFINGNKLINGATLN